MKHLISFGHLNNELKIIIIIKIFLTIINNFCQLDNKLLRPLLYYFGNFLCFIPLLINRKCFKEKLITLNQKLEGKNKKVIKYLYNNPYATNLNMKDIFYIIIVSLLALFQDFLDILIQLMDTNNNIKNDINNQYLFFFEFLIWFLFSKYILKITYYKHQEFSIIGIVIIGIIRLIYRYYYLGNKWNIELIKFLIKIIYIIFNSIFYGYIKGLMKYKFLSPYTCCFIIGLINFTITLIVYIIVLNIPCNFDFFCKDELITFEHFDSKDPVFVYDKDPPLFGFKIIDNKIITITFLIIIPLILGINSVIINITMNDFSVYHIIIPINIGYFLIFLIEAILQPDKNYAYIIFSSILFFVEFLMYFIFLEIIELNFCNLNKNIKKNIKKRAKDDLLIKEIDSFYEEIEENEEEGELMNDVF